MEWGALAVFLLICAMLMSRWGYRRASERMENLRRMYDEEV